MRRHEEYGAKRAGGEVARCALCALFLIAIAKDEMTRRKKEARNKREEKQQERGLSIWGHEHFLDRHCAGERDRDGGDYFLITITTTKLDNNNNCTVLWNGAVVFCLLLLLALLLLLPLSVVLLIGLNALRLICADVAQLKAHKLIKIFVLAH